MKKSLIIIFMAIGLAGCIPLQQSNITGGQKNDYFKFEDGYGLLNVGSWNDPKTIHLLDSESYAIGPNKEKYGIKSEPHDYDVSQKYPYIRDRIYVMDNGKALKHLRNGNWRFVFYFTNTDGRDSRTFDTHLWTFYYCPIIHGPPN